MRPLSYCWQHWALLDLSGLTNCIGRLCHHSVSKVISCAAATGNDVCKEYNASHVAYDYAMRGEDWATSPNKAWS